MSQIGSAIGTTVCVMLLLMTAVCGHAQELYILDDAGAPVLLTTTSPAPAGSQPVLFVHGHNVQSDADADFNFRKNFIDGLDGLPSFAQALALPENANLGLEAYFLRLIDQDRSIVADAADVRSSLEQILARHEAQERVVIIAYSKGALSSRLALKSLVEQIEGLPAPQPDSIPVAEFIAIAPPNHGLRSVASLISDSLSSQQMHNGYSPPGEVTGLCLPVGDSAARDFVEQLNGHPMADSHADAVPLGSYPEEAPGSRAPGDDPASGILYVTLYASGNRDFVGGDLPPGATGNSVLEGADCQLPVKQGRVVARNLAADAINLSLGAIPGANAIEVHANTVHSGHVICQALHTAVHHAPPSAGECVISATSIPTIEPARRVGVELVLDYSGSMQQPGCPDCAAKSQVLAEAAGMFIDLWQVVAAPGDHIGVTLFGSQAQRMRCAAGQACTVVGLDVDVPESELLVPVNNMVVPIQTLIANHPAAGATNMSAGLREAITRLQAFAGVRKRIVVFTDGMQNVAPKVRYEPFDCEDGDCPLLIDGASPVALDLSLEIPVDTIGVGVGDAWLGLLNDLSLATGGVSRTTISPDGDLAAFFTDSIVDTLAGFSPQRVATHRGTLAETPTTHRFEVNANVRRIMLTLRGDVNATIARDEKDLTERGRMIARAGYKLWTLALPPGPASVWTVTLAGQPGDSYETGLLVDEPELEFRVSAGQRLYTVGESMQMEAEITVGGAVIKTPVDVSVTLRRPGKSAANVLATQTRFEQLRAPATEAGDTPAHKSLAHLLRVRDLYDQMVHVTQSQPLTRNDRGHYSGQSAPLSVPGSRLLEFVVSGEHPRLGRFQRSRSVSVMVGMGAASAKISTLRADLTRDGDDSSRWSVVLTPRDEIGNHLGPGFGSRIRVRLDGTVQAFAEDLGNGTYRVALDASANPASSVQVAVSGVQLFEGTVADIATAPAITPREPWQYGLALALVLLLIGWFRRILRPNASRSARQR